MKALANTEQEANPLSQKLQAYVIQGAIKIDNEEKTVKLISMQNPITTLKHKFLYEKNTFKEIETKVLSLKSTISGEEKSITAEYLLSYILPLFAFDFTLWNQVVLFLVFFLTLGFLCIRHNYYSVNIVLEAAGYRLFQCSLANSDNVKTDQLMISKQRLNELVGTDIYVLPLNNDYGLDVSANCKFQ